MSLRWAYQSNVCLYTYPMVFLHTPHTCSLSLYPVFSAISFLSFFLLVFLISLAWWWAGGGDPLPDPTLEEEEVAALVMMMPTTPSSGVVGCCACPWSFDRRCPAHADVPVLPRPVLFMLFSIVVPPGVMVCIVVLLTCTCPFPLFPVGKFVVILYLFQKWWRRKYGGIWNVYVSTCPAL